MKMKKKSIKILITSAVLVVTLLISFGQQLGVPTWDEVFTVFSPTPVPTGGDGLYVHFIDVGCGDSIYIACDGYNVLIDAGNPSRQEVAAMYLREQGVKKLDLVIGTHPDKDHIGDLSSVIRRVGTVTRFWSPALPKELIPTADFYTDIFSSLAVRSSIVENPQPGRSLQLGDMRLTVIAPRKMYDTDNNNSIVVRLTYKNNSFLFTGDAEKKSEKDILKSGMNIRADVLKVGHHGSKSSSTKEFIRAVSPKYAVISVGDNSYGLPKNTVIRRIEKQNVKVYRTDNYGTIVFHSDGTTVTPLIAA